MQPTLKNATLLLSSLAGGLPLVVLNGLRDQLQIKVGYEGNQQHLEIFQLFCQAGSKHQNQSTENAKTIMPKYLKQEFSYTKKWTNIIVFYISHVLLYNELVN